MNGTAVIGVGNILLGDDGIGVRVIEELESAGGIPGVELIDAGTAAFDMLDAFLRHDRIIMVDALRGGHQPGTVYVLTPQDLTARGRFEVSLHDVQVLELVELSARLGTAPEVVIVGVEPADVSLDLELSTELAERLPHVLRVVQDLTERQGASRR